MLGKSEYIDTKAESIKDFDMLANFMWRRASYLLKKDLKTDFAHLSVIDPCAGGAKLFTLLSNDPLNTLIDNITVYEPDYSKYMYAKAVLSNFNPMVINAPFELHFSVPYFPEFNLAISIPYTDRQIDSNLEKDIEYLKCKSYAYYVINRSLDILLEGGFGVFALPKTMVDGEYFQQEIDLITKKAKILSVESYNEHAIILLQKDVIK